MIDNNKCQRIDPCNNYDCSAIANSACVTNGANPQCVCDNNYSAYLEDGSGTSAEYTDSVFFDNSNSQITCAPALPCVMNPCDSAENKVNIIVD